MAAVKSKLPPALAALTVDAYAQVKGIYDLYRDLRMNVLYFGSLLKRLQRWNLAMEISIAVTTSATIGAVEFFKPALPYFAALAALLGVLKPILRLSNQIERYSKQWSGYLNLSLQARGIVREIQESHQVTPEMLTVLVTIRHRVDDLSAQDNPSPSKSALRRFQHDVNEEMPADALWSPPIN